MQRYQTNSAVLFLIFNRPQFAREVFEKIKETQPSKLYIAADGPRPNRPDDEDNCNKCKSLIDLIDWQCEIKTLFREENLGCKYAVSSAISWFFEHEEKGIILEDDCLPSNDFFRFADEMLEKYRYDTRIRHITGSNLQRGKIWGDSSYYFSNNIHVWGWAGWRRAWQDYDVELAKYDEGEVYDQFLKIFPEKLLAKDWTNIFKQLKSSEIDTWDYQLGITNFFHNGLCVIPNMNLISNIGFGVNATHTFDNDNVNSNISHGFLPEKIVHPKYILPEKEADKFTWFEDFDIENRLKRDQRRSSKSRVIFNSLKRLLYKNKTI